MDCPYCSEPLEDEDAVDCPECGEALDDDRGADSSSDGSSKTILIVVGVVFLLLIFGGGLLVAIMVPALSRAKMQAGRTKCSNNLRQLGLAGIMYSDDKRFFPHVGSLQELDGDVDTNHGPKVFRTLIYYGYHDNPEGFVCPESYDMFIPTGSEGRQWFWDGGTNPSPDGVSPLVDDAPDPALSETTEISYGWTRKGMSSNVRSTAVLGADRAMRDGTGDESPLAGNHEDGWNVLRADGTVSFESPASEPFPGWITATQPQGGVPGGYLGIKVLD